LGLNWMMRFNGLIGRYKGRGVSLWYLKYSSMILIQPFLHSLILCFTNLYQIWINLCHKNKWNFWAGLDKLNWYYLLQLSCVTSVSKDHICSRNALIQKFYRIVKVLQKWRHGLPLTLFFLQMFLYTESWKSIILLFPGCANFCDISSTKILHLLYVTFGMHSSADSAHR